MILTYTTRKDLIVFITLFFVFTAGFSSNTFAVILTQQDTIPPRDQPIKQPVYTTSRLVTPKPVIDGKLDDECWKQGTWAGDYHQFIPNEGAKPTYPTEHEYSV